MVYAETAILPKNETREILLDFAIEGDHLTSAIKYDVEITNIKRERTVEWILSC